MYSISVHSSNHFRYFPHLCMSLPLLPLLYLPILIQDLIDFNILVNCLKSFLGQSRTAEGERKKGRGRKSTKSLTQAQLSYMFFGFLGLRAHPHYKTVLINEDGKRPNLQPSSNRGKTPFKRACRKSSQMAEERNGACFLL